MLILYSTNGFWSDREFPTAYLLEYYAAVILHVKNGKIEGATFAELTFCPNDSTGIFYYLTSHDSSENLVTQGLPPIGTVIEPRGNRYGATKEADILSRLCGRMSASLCSIAPRIYTNEKDVVLAGNMWIGVLYS